MTAPVSPFLVLVAEDNSMDVGLVRHALKDQQIECTLRIASEGENALEQIGQIDRIHARPVLRPAAGPPVAVMTSTNAPSDQRFAEKHAALCYSGKPADLAAFMELSRNIRDILGTRQALREGA